MKKTFLQLVIVSLLSSTSLMADNQDARTHMIRGAAAIEIAKSPEDLQLAADEFRMATDIDPTLAVAWYDLGSVQSKMKLYNDAIASYQHYLSLIPNAADTQKIKDEIIKLEFLQERNSKLTGHEGTWIAMDATPYQLNIVSNKWILSTTQHLLTENEVVETYPLVGNVSTPHAEQIKYVLNVNNQKVNGTWKRPSTKIDECVIPEEEGEVVGEVNDINQSIILKYTRAKFHAPVYMSLLSNDYCGDVTQTNQHTVNMSFYGPLKRGGLGLYLEGFFSYYDGGFSSMYFGWNGQLRAVNVPVNSAAYAAGLRSEDKILSINGLDVKKLSAPEAVQSLRGEINSEVTLGVLHSDTDKPVTIKMKRVDVGEYTSGSAWIN
jgi:tetratricopeptide (TPR) repeat protein